MVRRHTAVGVFALAGLFVSAGDTANAATQWSWGFDNPNSFCCSGRQVGTLVTDGTLEQAKTGPLPTRFAITDFSVNTPGGLLNGDKFIVPSGAGFTWNGSEATKFDKGASLAFSIGNSAIPFDGNSVIAFDTVERLPDNATGEPTSLPAFSVLFGSIGGSPVGAVDVQDAFSATGGKLDLAPVLALDSGPSTPPGATPPPTAGLPDPPGTPGLDPGSGPGPVAPIPVPAALPLFASALLGLGIVRRRRK